MNNENRALKQAAIEGVITCQKCGNLIEPDCPQCQCGWDNPIGWMV